MNFLDMRTIIFVVSLTYIICTFFIYILYRQNRNRFNGLLLIFINFVLQSVGILLIALRGKIPNFFSIILANTFIVVGIFISLIGYEKFLNKEGKHYHNIVLVIIVIIIQIYFTYFKPSLPYRRLITSIIISLLCFQIFYLFIFRNSKDEKKNTFYIGIVYLLYSFVSLARAFEIFIIKSDTNDFFKVGVYDSLIIILYQILFIILTYTIILTLNKKLIYNLKKEEEKFLKSFHVSPYAITLTDFENGRIIEANEGFERITGYSTSEVVGQKTVDLKLWESESEREMFIKKLKEEKSVYNYEVKFKRKSGELGTGLLSANIIDINNKKIILASVNDITERKETEEKIKTLLNEKEMLLKEVHHRIKNNMNIIYSLLYLEIANIDDKKTKNIIIDAANRIQSMMVLYDKLYRQNIKESLSIKDYLSGLVNEILRIFPDTKKIDIKLDIEDIRLDQNRISKLGILINELVTNSVKYAFTGINNSIISLKIFLEDNYINIDYRDNGVGITNSNKDTQGFGMELIKILVEELKGKITIKEDNGTNFIISFPF